MSQVDVHSIARKRLAAIDQRYSTGRQQLVETLHRAAHPMVATEIVEATRDLPQSSVYRNLAVLESAGVVVKVLTNGDRAAFELAEEMKGHHHHIVCVACGQVLDIDIPQKVERLLDEGMSVVMADVEADRLAARGAGVALQGGTAIGNELFEVVGHDVLRQEIRRHFRANEAAAPAGKDNRREGPGRALPD